MKAKEILLDIMNAHCLSYQNFKTVIKFLEFPMGTFVNISMEKCREMVLDAITENQAKEIINQMPFPYIETAIGYYGDYYCGRDSMYWINDVLIQRKNIQSVFTGYGVVYRN